MFYAELNVINISARLWHTLYVALKLIFIFFHILTSSVSVFNSIFFLNLTFRTLTSCWYIFRTNYRDKLFRKLLCFDAQIFFFQLDRSAAFQQLIHENWTTTQSEILSWDLWWVARHEWMKRQSLSDLRSFFQFPLRNMMLMKRLKAMCNCDFVLKSRAHKIKLTVRSRKRPSSEIFVAICIQ